MCIAVSGFSVAVDTLPVVISPFLGSEALASRMLTRHMMRTRYAPIYPDVYLPRNTEVNAVVRAQAAWLWMRRRGAVTGCSAAALHGAKWVDGRRPAQVLCGVRRSPVGIETWLGAVAEDELTVVRDIVVTTPERTALDIGCRDPVDVAVAAIDALARATRIKIADVVLLAEKHKGMLGVRQARTVLALADPGAESPRETWLRLLVIRGGFPAPRTQIRVHDGYGVLVAILDMGWEHLKIALDCEGDHHRTDRRQFNHDIRRAEALRELGWIQIRVTVEDTQGGILHRVGQAFARRECKQGGESRDSPP